MKLKLGMFRFNKIVKQRCVVNKLLFNIVPHKAVKKCRQWKIFNVGYWKTETIQVTELSYADAIVVFGNKRNPTSKRRYTRHTGRRLKHVM